MMYLPKLYTQFAQNYPDIQEKYKQLAEVCRAAGPLDAKVQELVMLGIAVGVNSRGGVMSHTRKALAAGVTQEEITHAILLSLTSSGFSNMMAAMNWADEVFEQGKP
ncbi:MAG: carboxymuconolactone decarboxylase family protein [Desulfobacterales bacterium]|jgi:AhpD family alkylhydroperoxidase|nr:carboxymuconolactone decarboxylase family protein [Desulfobacterales bacterium]